MHKENLIWIDLEMTGLDPETDVIIEIATLVTDKTLNTLAEGPVLAIHQPDNVLENMNPWCINQHQKTGLTDRVKASTVTIEQAEAQTLEFLKQWVPANQSPMCGNSICQDRRFLAKSMQDLQAYFHYRNLDVSTLKELAKRWKPSVFDGLKKNNTHLAMDDIKDSIEELKHYREHFIDLS